VTRYLYHVSHEQHRPSALLEYVRAAEAAGFEGAVSSDHFHPWVEEQGQSGFAWSWLGAAMQATQFSFGIVNAPGARYHPAIVAQAAATLAEMFPDRFWIAVGSGEALNEHILGTAWPTADVRLEMLEEAVEVIRALWTGDVVSHRGTHYTVDTARIYTLPEQPPPIYVSAFGPKAVDVAARIGDGFVAFLVPAVVFALYFATLMMTGGIGWSIHLWLGAIVIAGIIGLFLDELTRAVRGNTEPATS